MIQKIYKTEDKLRKQDLLSDGFLKKRQIQVTPLLDNLKKWLDKKYETLRPSRNLGKAVTYTLGQWEL